MLPLLLKFYSTNGLLRIRACLWLGPGGTLLTRAETGVNKTVSGTLRSKSEMDHKNIYCDSTLKFENWNMSVKKQINYGKGYNYGNMAMVTPHRLQQSDGEQMVPHLRYDILLHSGAKC